MPRRREVFGDGASVERAGRRSGSVRPRSGWGGAAGNGPANGHDATRVAGLVDYCRYLIDSLPRLREQLIARCDTPYIHNAW